MKGILIPSKLHAVKRRDEPEDGSRSLFAHAVCFAIRSLKSGEDVEKETTVWHLRDSSVDVEVCPNKMHLDRQGGCAPEEDSAREFRSSLRSVLSFPSSSPS